MKNQIIFNEVSETEFITTISGSFIIEGESLPFTIEKAHGRMSWQFNDKGKDEQEISIEYMVWNFNILAQMLGRIVPKSK